MASKKKKSDTFVRCFEVGQPTLHQKGHTIYKITQKVIHVDAPEKEVEEYIVWRRYNDINKLYTAMHKLHLALHRREEFPPFARSKVFGRFEESVIIDRMRSAQDLLNFIGQKFYLVNSRAFQQFFEGAEKVAQKPSDLLQPTRLGDSLKSDKKTPCEASSDSESLSSNDPTSEKDTGSAETWEPQGEREIVEDLLGGVWQYRQIADEISLGEGSSDEQTDFTDDSALSTPLPDAELSFFDPLTMPEGLPQTTGSDLSNEWLLSMCTPEENGTHSETDSLKRLGEELVTGTVEGSSKVEPAVNNGGPLGGESLALENNGQKNGANDVAFSEDSSPFDFKPKSGSVLECGKGDLTSSPFHQEKVTPKTGAPEHPAPGLGAAVPPDLAALGEVSSSGEDLGPSPTHSHASSSDSSRRSPKKGLSSALDMRDKADYIILAANQISLAQQCEANNNYNMAFSYYKSGVGILLTGVQKDENAQRREVVRRKTARYLIKAEELYHKYLADVEEQERNRWDTGHPSPAKELLNPNVAFLQGAMAEMRKFKVLGIIDKVILVMDPDTEGTYVIKVLSKRCGNVLPGQRSIVPNYIPYMVRLYKFYETDSAIFLLLQHATGGKLWTYVGAFLSQHQHEHEHGVLDDPHKQEPRSLTGKVDSLQSSTTVRDRSSTGASELTEINLNGAVTPVESEACDIKAKGNFVELFCDQTAGFSKGMDPEDPADESTIYSASTKSKAEKSILFNRQDSDFLNMDISHDTSGEFHPVPNSNNRKSSSDYLYHNVSASPRTQEGGFTALLKGTQPSNEYFSINSFDSDTGHTARYGSSTSDQPDHIESIPEVSENSPMPSPYKMKNEAAIDSANREEEVFPCDVNNPTVVPSTVISDANKVLAEVESDLNEIDKESDLIFSAVSPVNKPVLHSTPRPKSLLPTQEDNIVFTRDPEPDEPSIYDTFKPANYEDSASSSSPVETLHISATDEVPSGGKVTHVVTTVDIEPLPSSIVQPGIIGEPSTNPGVTKGPSSGLGKSPETASSIPSHRPEIYRVPSQERSAETPRKARRRRLSSVFADLDLAEQERRQQVARLPEGCVRQWAAELIVALTQLHSMGIVCGDLHPGNILLGDGGHILLTYQCQWAIADHEYHQGAITRGYAAPEMLGAPTQACDWWSVGTLLYELLTGKSFGSCHSAAITTHTQMYIPESLSAEAQSLLQELLRYDPQERLGSGLDGSADIRLHPFFNDIRWSELQGQMSIS